jgi:maleamate amidohydrolase
VSSTTTTAHTGLAGELGFGRPSVVLVVDVCLAYLDDYSPLRAPVEDAVEASARLVDAARQDLIPMLFTRVQFQHGGADSGLFFQGAGLWWALNDTVRAQVIHEW